MGFLFWKIYITNVFALDIFTNENNNHFFMNVNNARISLYEYTSTIILMARNIPTEMKLKCEYKK